MDLKKTLAKNKTILILIPSLEYNDQIVDFMKQLTGKSICYVTLNKTYDSLKEVFNNADVNMDKVVFIDAISKTIKSVPDQTRGCYYISSPGALTELSLVISKFLRHDFNYIIFDSLTNLTIYEKKAPVAKFLSILTNKIREKETKALFYALDMDQHQEMIQECSMFVDKVVKQ